MRRYKSVGFLSSFCVEAMAVVEALELTLGEGWPAVTVFFDSRSVLSVVQARFVPGRSSYFVLCIKPLILDLTERGMTVKLVWIPGHRGVAGNERADAVARNAVWCERNSNIEVPLGELKNFWKANLRSESFCGAAKRRGLEAASIVHAFCLILVICGSSSGACPAAR